MGLVSVLISTYNSEKWITSCVNSILKQTYKNLQIVIVDDGSSDKTLEKLDIIKDPRIEMYKKKHTGISDSLNYGLTKTRSNLIVKVDSDDYSFPTRIENQYYFMRENPEYGLVGTNFLSVNDEGKLLQRVNYPETCEQIIAQLQRKCSIFHGSILIKKNLFDKVGGYNTDFRVAHDWDLFLKLIGKTKLYNIQKYLVAKKLHPDAISLSPAAKIEAEWLILSYNQTIIEEAGESTRRSDAYFNIGYHYYYKDDLKKSASYFKKAIKEDKFSLQKIRYYISSKFFNKVVLFFRKYKLYKIFDPLRGLDKNNRFFINK